MFKVFWLVLVSVLCFAGTLLFLFISNSALAESPRANPAEKWECKASSYNWANIIVRAVVFKGRKKGTIAVAGITHETEFLVAGFNRRWDWGPLDDSQIYPFAFIMEPTGKARYYDFSLDREATTTPSMVMDCRLTK